MMLVLTLSEFIDVLYRKKIGGQQYFFFSVFKRSV